MAHDLVEDRDGECVLAVVVELKMRKWPAMISWTRHNLLQSLARYNVLVWLKRTYVVQ
jgi:hypothetical protein